MDKILTALGVAAGAWLGAKIGAIAGTAIAGPIGTILGTAVGLTLGAIIGVIIGWAKDDIFTPQLAVLNVDMSQHTESLGAVFDVPSTTLQFDGFGGTDRVNCRWQLAKQ